VESDQSIKNEEGNDERFYFKFFKFPVKNLHRSCVLSLEKPRRYIGDSIIKPFGPNVLGTLKDNGKLLGDFKIGPPDGFVFTQGFRCLGEAVVADR